MNPDFSWDSPKPIRISIEEARARCRAAHGEADFEVAASCEGRGRARVAPQFAHGGRCKRCDENHFLRITEESKKYALELIKWLREVKAGNSLKMVGVLVCLDNEGSLRILRAFSGSYDFGAASRNANWCPPLSQPREDEVPAITGRIQSVSQEIKDRDQARFALAKEKEGKTEEQVRQINEKLEAINNIRNVLRDELHLLQKSLMLVANYRSDEPQGVYQIQNPKNQEIHSIGQLGVCAAPKLLAEARRKNYLPLSIAEFYWGKEKGEAWDRGTFVESCTYCRSILGFTLCGLKEKMQARFAAPETQPPEGSAAPKEQGH